MKEFISSSLSVAADESTGYLRSIKIKNDIMNWVLYEGEWGRVGHFGIQNTTVEGDRLVTKARHDSGMLELTIERYVEDGKYTEKYSVKNIHWLDVFIKPDTFGIHFPFDCKMIRGNITEQFKTKCTAHVWPGESSSWIYGAKIGGKPPYLVAHLTEGSMSEYSIERDMSMTRSCSDYRGIILLNPTPTSILPGESAVYKFVYEGTDKHPKDYLKEDTNQICIESDKFSVNPSETTVLDVFCRSGLADICASVNGKELAPELVDENHASSTETTTVNTDSTILDYFST